MSNRVEGTIIATEGIGNFRPSFSLDGKKLYYTSTKRYDYNSFASIYELDLSTKKRRNWSIRSPLQYRRFPTQIKLYMPN